MTPLRSAIGFSIAVAVGTGCATIVAPAPVATTVTVHAHTGIFYDELSPYGEWVWVTSYGWVWSPYGVHVGWRPYTNGTWTYTQYGWTWVSAWNWGWAPFHYGWWAFDPVYGWIWIPGDTWGPAWVVWHSGGGWVGWAPLPPHTHYDRHDGLYRVTGSREGGSTRTSTSAREAETGVANHAWTFVKQSDLTAANIGSRAAAPVSNARLLTQTKPVTQYETKGDLVINNAIPRRDIETAVGKSIPVRTLVDVTRPDAKAGGDHEVPMFRPKAPRAPGAVTPSKDHQDALQQLRTQQDEERARLDARQKDERSKPPAGLTDGELQRRQEAERKAFEEQSTREQKLLEQWQRREDARRQVQPPPPTRKYIVKPRPTPTKAPAPKKTPPPKKQQPKKSSGKRGSGRTGR